jgi:hypothetical protein
MTISQGDGVLKRDTTKITVSRASEWSGEYVLAFAKPADDEGHIELYMASEIEVGGSA